MSESFAQGLQRYIRDTAGFVLCGCCEHFFPLAEPGDWCRICRAAQERADDPPEEPRWT